MNDEHLSELLRAEVPAPGPGYWDTIDASLAGDPVTDRSAEPVVDHATDDPAVDDPTDLIDPGVPAVVAFDRRRRTRARLLTAVAAVALAAVAVGTALVVGPDNDTVLDAAREPSGADGQGPTAESGRTPDESDSGSDAESDSGDGDGDGDGGTRIVITDETDNEAVPGSNGTADADGDDAVDESTAVGPAPPPFVEPIAYEGFDLGLADGDAVVAPAETETTTDPDTGGGHGGGSSTGFVDGVGWSVTSGAADVTFDEVGLDYGDSSGVRLATSPGAVRVRPVESSPRLTRELAAPLVTADGYWVGYLLRLDSERAGDAFWTTDGSWDRGSAGLQSRAMLQVVNGQRSDVIHETGATHFIVIQVTGEGAAVWIDPELDGVGQPDLVDERLPLDTDLALFKFNTLNDGAYTIDEFRIGGTFAQVAPARDAVVSTPRSVPPSADETG